jgi:hypothetical protein
LQNPFDNAWKLWILVTLGLSAVNLLAFLLAM